MPDYTMSNHPNRSRYRYRKVSQGFANTVIYFRVPADKVPEVEAYFANYEDEGDGRWSAWTTDRKATQPGIAVDWADRAYVGLISYVPK